jgi:hypothetical protein
MNRFAWTCVVVLLSLTAASCEQGVCDASLMGQSLEELPRLGDAGVPVKGPHGYMVAGDIDFFTCSFCDFNPDARPECAPCKPELRATFQELDAPYTGPYHYKCELHTGTPAAVQNCRVWVRDDKVVGVSVRCLD